MNGEQTPSVCPDTVVDTPMPAAVDHEDDEDRDGSFALDLDLLVNCLC